MATVFSKETCLKLFRDVTQVPHSIELASSKISFWKKHAHDVVHYWDVVFRESSPEHRLNLVYVANDVLQKCRNGKDFAEAFYRVLPGALKHMIKHADEKLQQKVKRVVDIWGQRNVFGKTAMKELRTIVAVASEPTSVGVPEHVHVPSDRAAPSPAASRSSAGLLGALSEVERGASVLHGLEQAASAALLLVSNQMQAGGADPAVVSAALQSTRTLLEGQERQRRVIHRVLSALEEAKALQQASADACTARVTATKATVQELERMAAQASQSGLDPGRAHQAAAAGQSAGDYVHDAARLQAHHPPPDHYEPASLDSAGAPDSYFASLDDGAMHRAQQADGGAFGHALNTMESYDPSDVGTLAAFEAPQDAQPQQDDEINRIAELVTSMDPDQAAALLYGVITTTDETTKKMFGEQMNHMIQAGPQPPR